VKRALLVIVLLLAVLGGAWWLLSERGLLPAPWAGTKDVSRVMVVAAAPDSDGDVVGKIILLVDVSGAAAEISVIDPGLTVTIPGTDYTTLGDAYPFGGGRLTAEAYALAEGVDASPFVAISPEALGSAVDAADGVKVTLPAAMSVYDGERLYSFARGATVLDGSELFAVLKGAEFLGAGDAGVLRDEVAGALVGLLAGWPGGLAESPGVSSDLTTEQLSQLELAMAGR
jgi:hypothetical protein